MLYEVITAPNPFESNFTLRLPNFEKVTSLLIFDQVGQLITTITNGFSETMTLGGELNSGIYCVVIFGEQTPTVIRVVKK